MSLFPQSLPPNQLPDWMRRAQRGLDWGFLLVLILSLIVSAPFALRSELPHNNANENYVYRTSDYAESLQEGWLYPRWSPNVLGGYGAPIPSFYPPAPTYAAALLQVLLTNSSVSAVRLLYIIAMCVAGVAMYTFVLRRSGAAVGILAAMLYIYSPYVSLIVPHVQGDLTEMIILALTPALLWATDRLMRGRQTPHLLITALVIAALILTSPKGAVAACLLAFVYVIWQYEQIKPRSKVFQFFAAIGLGALLAGFYWIPALVEQYAVHWQMTTNGIISAIRLNELISPIVPIDPAEMIHYPQLTVGLVAIVFALGGGVIHFFVNRKFDLGFGIFFLISGVMIALVAVLFFSSETWLLGVIVLCFSVAGSDVLLLRGSLSSRLQRLFLPVLMVGIWLGSQSSWVPPVPTQPFGNTDGAAQIDYEQQGFGVAVLRAGEALPSTLPSTLAFNRSLIDSYRSSSINKLQQNQLASSFQASLLAHFVHGDQFQLRQVTEPITVTILTAFFPGWQASIDDQRLNLRADPDTGLIQVDLPTSRGLNTELSVTLGSTNVRLGSWIIAGLGLLILIILTWGKYRTLPRSSLEDLELLKLAEARLIALPIFCFGLVATLLVVPNPVFSIAQASNSGLQGSFSTQMRSNTGLTLRGFRLTNNVYSPKDELNITLFWQAQRFLPDNYQVKMFLKNNTDLSVWNETPLRNPGYYPTRRWNTQQYVPDVYQFQLADGMPQGNYQIHVEAFDCVTTCDDSQRLDFFNTDGQSLGADVILPTLISIRR